jgi:DNA-binding NarL/FixJ family response regulator
MTAATIKLLIIEPQKLLREGLVALFAEQPGIAVLGNGENGLEAIEMATTLQPNVVILGMNMPVMDGLTAAVRLRKLDVPPEIVILAGDHHEIRMKEAFESGARAYLLKDCEFEELEFAVRKAAEGEYYVAGQAGKDLVNEFIKPVLSKQKPGGIMTQRERELARLLADGYSTKEAAQVLNISTKTAESHRTSIMKKLGARNVTDIVKYCIRNHIIEA